MAQVDWPTKSSDPIPSVSSSNAPLSNPSGEGSTGFMSCFFSTFVTIFLAEVGDKTQVATLLMSAQSHQPWVVFTGAATALVGTSLLGVLIGRWLTRFLAPRTLEIATGVILAIVSVLLFIDVAGLG